MTDGKHTVQAVVKADAKSASRGLNQLGRENKQLYAEVDRLSAALGKAEKANERMASSTARLTAAQRLEAQAARAQQSAIDATAAAVAKRTIDQARRGRESAMSSGKATTAQRLDAIRREEQARLHQVNVEARSATSVAEAFQLQNRALEITHQAYMHRQRVEVMAAQQTADAKIATFKRVQASQAAGARAQAGAGGGGLSNLAAAGGAVGIAAGGAMLIGGITSKIADLGAESLVLQSIFDSLPYSLNAARTATRGLADDVTLARSAIMANQSGVATSAQAYAELTGMAQMLALKMGRDVSETVGRVTQGIAKQERELLDELVILPRMEEMWEAYAKTQGKATKDLTDLEKNTAFTTSAMDAMRKATAGLELNMDTAAASIARTTVRVKNLRNAALGGVESQRSLAEGVKTLDLTILRQVADMDTYRNSFYTVSAALDDAGVSTAEYATNSTKLQADIEKLLRSEAARLVKLAERKKLTEEDAARAEELLQINGVLSGVNEKILRKDLERLGAVKAQTQAQIEAAAESKKAKESELVDIENQLAFGKAAKISQAQLNLLIQDEARLRAEILDLEGDTAKAADARRTAELAAFEAAGESVAPKKGKGGKGKSRKDAARELAEAEADARIAGDARARDAVLRSVDRQRASYNELRVAVLAVQASERMRAQMEIEHAKGKAETMRAETAMLDLRAQQGSELADLAEKEAEAERDRAAALWQGAQASQARAQADLKRAQELQAAGSVSRPTAPGRPTLAQGLGIDAAPMSGQNVQAKAEMDAEHARASEMRALRQQQLDEERAYQATRAEDEATRVEATAELRRIDDEQSQLYHEAQLARLQERVWLEDEAFAREQERVATRNAMISQATSFGLAQAESAMKGAISIAKTERAARRAAMDAARKDGKSQAEIAKAGEEAAKVARGNALISLGEELQGQGIAYSFKALAAAISLNPVGAATNAAAAAVMFGGAAAVKSRGRTLAGSGSSGSDGGGATAGGGGGQAPVTNPLGNGSSNDFPGSQRPPTPGNPAGGASAPSVVNAGGRTRTINLTLNAPLVDEKTVVEIRDTIERLDSEG